MELGLKILVSIKGKMNNFNYIKKILALQNNE